MIKKGLLLIGILGLIFSCGKSITKDYAKLTGKIENATTKEVLVKSRGGYSKSIKVDENGVFSDTLHLSNKGELYILSANGTIRVFLKNGDDVSLTLDAEKLSESLKFTGAGSNTNNYLADKTRLQSTFNLKDLFKLEKPEFEKQSTEISNKFNGLMDKYKDIDSSFYAEEKEALSTLPQMFKERYEQMHAKKVTLNGKPSPSFTDYENFKGGKTSLKDLRGKFVYIDVWATWCRPCLGEIPHLQKLEEAFKGKKIQFVSISVDRETVKAGWRKMITDKKMGGIQLFAKKGDSFAKEYKISSIPRFILLDPKGNVVEENMSRPSDPKTKQKLKELLK